MTSRQNRDSGDEQQQQPDALGRLIEAWGRNNSGLWAPTMFRRTSLDMPDDIDYDTWEFMGTTLRDIGNAAPWWLGDWARGGNKFGEMHTQAFTHHDYADGSIANMKYVAEIYPPERRRENLPWSVHQAVASVMRQEPEEADKILDQAEEEGLTRDEVRVIVQEWWKDRRGPAAPERAYQQPGTGGNTVNEPGSAYSLVYVQSLERIALAFSKTDPNSWGSCRYCGVVNLEDVGLEDHSADCLWRMANMFVAANGLEGLSGGSPDAP